MSDDIMNLKQTHNVYHLAFNNWWDHINSCDLCSVICPENGDDFLDECEEGERLHRLASKWFRECRKFVVMLDIGGRR